MSNTDGKGDSTKAHQDNYGVLPNHMGGGPHGLGDPDDRTLRVVEKEILIPKKVQQKSKDKCEEEVKAFSVCGNKAGLLLPFKCRPENKAMKECLMKWYRDDAFLAEVTEEYLKDRSDYRRSGISKKQQRASGALS